MRRALALALLVAAAPALAQQDDRSYLTAFLEDNLSDAGRAVTITGFSGALSSQASIESLTIADDQGVWITLNGIVLDWSRSSLLSGQFVVNELSAKEIIVARAPDTGDSGLPDPEAAGFSLPELPVSVEIGRVAADRIVLEPALFGQAVEGSLEASLSLVAGEGKASFALLRSDDGPEGQITLDASYSNLGRQLDLSLRAIEGKGGLAATLLGLPGTPAAELSVIGSGPFEDFGADLQLSTDGVSRLAGRVTLMSDPAAGSRFNASLAGDPAPLFLPDYAKFFGSDVALTIAGSRSPEGRLALDDLSVTTQALTLDGKAVVAADGSPDTVVLTGTLALADGAPVLLPFGEVETRVSSATIGIDYDRATGPDWRGAFVMLGLDRADFKAARLTIDGSGSIAKLGTAQTVDAVIGFAATGLQATDPGLATAIGDAVDGSITAQWREGSGALQLPALRLTGADYEGSGNLAIEGLDEAFTTSGHITLTADDFARFAALAGRPLGGSGTVTFDGSASRLSGFFDLVARFTGQGLRLGLPEVDRLLDGPSTLTASVLRDDTGTTLRSLEVSAKTLTVTGAGKLSSAGSDLAGRLTMSDLSALGPGYRGALALDAGFTGTVTDGRITAKGTGTALATGQAEVDRLLAGQSTLQASIALKDGEVQIEDARLANPQFTVTASGKIAGAAREIDLTARLADLGLLVPQFRGPLTVSGTALQDATGYLLNLKGTGPGGVDAKVTGRVADTFDTADLAVSGTGQAALANVFLAPRAVSGPVRFDLSLKGAPRLASLAGRVSLSGGRLTDPDLGFAFERAEMVADLGGGTARLSATTQLSSGGKLRLDGTIGLSAPYPGALSMTLDRLRLTNPELFETSASGSVRIDGPLVGGALVSGRIDLSDTEIRVPSTGVGSAAGLADLRHVNEPGAVRATRAKAGLLGGTDAGGSDFSRAGGYRLDLEISAPNRVFIRGRGIDAELGGAVRLGGTTAAIVPSGGLKLIRGRLDILGKRLVLSAADLRLEGGFVPDILISANTESDGIVSTVTIQGPADAPDVSFSSVPELPQEEVLARLLFGRGLQTISALQAAQLANAVAVLAGRGGDGVIGRLRKSFGLDDLDVTASDDGTAALKAGKYISENVYTEIEVDQTGKSRINLNLDIRPGVTVKGRVGAEGGTGIGIFVEKDY